MPLSEGYRRTEPAHLVYHTVAFMDHVTLACPSCRRSLRIRTSYLGLVVTCKHCAHDFRARDYARIECPQCRTGLDVRRDYLDRRVTCKQCGYAFVAQNVAAREPTAPDPSLEDTVFADDSVESLMAPFEAPMAAEPPTEIYETPDAPPQTAARLIDESSTAIDTAEEAGNDVATAASESPADAAHGQNAPRPQDKELRRQIESLQARLAELEPLEIRLTAAMADLERVRGRRNQLKTDLGDTLTLYEASKSEIARLTEAVAKSEESLGFAMQEVSELQRQVDELSERLEIIGRERDELRRASGELRDRVDHESRERELSERALTEARDELAHARDQLATVTERQADAEGQLARTRETLEHLQAQEQAWNQHRAELEQSLQTERERHAQQTDENAATWAQKERETREAHARVQAELDAAQTDLSTLREAVESARAEANETRAQHAESERARADMQRRLDEADALRSREQAEWKAQFEHEQAANRARCEELESRLQDSKAHATTLLENARGEWQARELDLQNQLIAVQGELAGARERIDGLSAELERMAENRVSAAAESDQRIARLRSDVETAARLQRSAEEREQAALRRCEALQAHIIKLEIELAAAHDTVFEGSQANANQQVAQLSTQLDAVTRKYQALRGQLRSMGINIG